jgi:cell division protein FtsI (penicillin-binding protein 3)
MKKVMPRNSLQKRVNFILIFILILFSILIFRLYYIQIDLHPKIEKKADRVHYKTVTAYPKRGTIFDRNGEVLAMSIETYLVSIFRDNFTGFDKLSELSSILECPLNEIKTKLDTKKNYVCIATQVSKKKARILRNWIRDKNIQGMQIEEDEKRLYPNGFEAKHLIGSVRKDNVGNEGLEKYYNDNLVGEPREYYVERKKIMQPVKLEQFDNPMNSTSIVLTIDNNIQHFVEVALEEAYQRTNAKNCLGIVMNPFTGEILAMAMKPEYDETTLTNFNNNQAQEILDSRRIKLITDIYEPGSTFKVILYSSVIELGLLDPWSNEQIFCENGSYRVRDRTIHDYHSYGWLSVRDVLVKSSNIGCAKISQRLSHEEFHEFIKKFGFGDKTDINIPGEMAGYVTDLKAWSDVKHSQVAFGQGVGITPIQMITAVSAVANGGFLRKPTVIKAILDNGEENNTQYNPKVVRRVISQKTAEEVTNIMIEVVERGTGKATKIPGYHIAGKTGTAQKYIKNVGYSPDKYVSSFIGFAPAEYPKFVIYIIVDEPVSLESTGGRDAAPVFREIAMRLLSYYRVTPSPEF